MLTVDPFFESLTKITEKPKKEAIPYLSQALDNDNWLVRWLAVQLLGALGPVAQDSVPVLEAEVEDDPKVFARYAAGEALKSIGHEHER